MKSPLCWFCLSLCLLILASCRQSKTEQLEGEDEDGPVWFEDVTDKLGIDFVHDCGPIDNRYFMPQIVGSGAALFDFDGDGYLDLYLLHGGGPKSKSPNQLYRQQRDGTFKNVSKKSGLDVTGHGQGVAVGDVNNDGKPDVLVTEYGRIRLFINQGGGKFKEYSAEETGLVNPLWGTSAAFLDYDGDGLLDLVVVNYVTYDPTRRCSQSGVRDYCSPKTFRGTATKLYKNISGTKEAKKPIEFRDVTIDSGLGSKVGPGLGVVAADFNGDGWTDLLIANDGQANFLWINKQNGTFREEGLLRGVAVNAMAQAEANMGIGWGDIDGDGLQDVFVTHLNVETNTLWKQGPPGQFRDWTGKSGLARPCWRATGFGTVLGDFNCDGWLDVVIANGGVTKNRQTRGSPLGEHWGAYEQRNQVFANEGAGRFRDLSPYNKALCGTPNVARGICMGDLRNDGVLTIVVTTCGNKTRLFRSIPERGHWVGVRVLDATGNRDIAGADVVVRAGKKRWIRTAHTSGSFLCSNDGRVHIGLGKVDRVDAIEVTWPGGNRETFPGGKVDCYYSLRQGKGKKVTVASPDSNN